MFKDHYALEGKAGITLTFKPAGDLVFPNLPVMPLKSVKLHCCRRQRWQVLITILKMTLVFSLSVNTLLLPLPAHTWPSTHMSQILLSVESFFYALQGHICRSTTIWSCHMIWHLAQSGNHGNLSHANPNYWSSSCTSKSDKGAGCPVLSKHVPHSLILHSEWKTCSGDLLSAVLGEKFQLKRANLSKVAVIFFHFAHWGNFSY